VWQENDEDPKAVVDYIVRQTEKDLLEDPGDFMPGVKKATEETISERKTSHFDGKDTVL
jgi:hypothetical protein